MLCMRLESHSPSTVPSFEAFRSLWVLFSPTFRIFGVLSIALTPPVRIYSYVIIASSVVTNDCQIISAFRPQRISQVLDSNYQIVREEGRIKCPGIARIVTARGN